MDDQLQTEAAQASQAGWDADPYGRHELRYWDGAGWTEHVSDNGITTIDKIEAPSPWSMMTEPAATPAPAPVATPFVAPEPAATPAPQPAAAPTPTPAPATSSDWNTLGPTTMPVPAWSPPAQAPVAFNPISFDQTPAKRPWYKRRFVLVALIIGIPVVLFALALPTFLKPDRIDAQPAAPTPAGFELVTADEYQFAAPATWRSQVIDENALNKIADSVDIARPGAGEALKDAAENGAMQGTKTLAVDPVTGDNVNVIPYEALRGDPRDEDNLAEIKDSFSGAQTGITPTSVTAEPGDVHGFPAAVITISAPFNGRTMTIISTIIQTGDRVFQFTVTSSSAQRAETVNQQILPTFAPH